MRRQIYGEIVKRTSGPQPEAPFRCKVFCGFKACATLPVDLNFTIASISAEMSHVIVFMLRLLPKPRGSR